MKTLKGITFVLLLAFTISIVSQEKKKASKLTLIVKDENNKPIPGASVLFDNKKYPRTTNSKGVFKIKLKKLPKEISIFSALHGITKVKYLGQKKILIKISPNKIETEIVASNQREFTAGAMQYRNIYDYLRGKVSGVRITTDNVVSIRGDRNREPLYILNGSPVGKTSFGDIVPSTIKSITILKGPETAIYGIRGMNGVIMVRTMM
jgi:TonB-dependent SusC/RagA subfamily outer membrane receptor|tara:strand:- start:3235 stop:3855 length:621 start_codon:yes stop_codon:yes gene_type:complete